MSRRAADHGDMRSYDPKRRRALDLLRFMDADGYLFRRKQAFLAYVQRKIRGQHYVAAKAHELWAHWLKEGAIRYLRAHPRIDGAPFTASFLRALSKEVAAREFVRIQRGHYVDLVVDGTISADGRARVVRWRRS